MPGFDGNGNWTRAYSWATDAANGITISSSKMDTEWGYIAGGFNNALTRDGQGKPSAAINWNGQNLTNVGTFGATGNATIGGALSVGGTLAVTDVATFTAAPVFTAQSGTRTALGATTVGANLFTLANPGAVRFVRINADNSVTARTAAEMLSDLGGASLSGAAFTGSVSISAAAYTPALAVTVAATTTINCAASNVFTLAMGTNITTLTVSSPANGQTINVRFTQDGTGSRTVAWPSSFKWAGGTAPVLTTTANGVDLLVATYFSGTGFWLASLTKDIR